MAVNALQVAWLTRLNELGVFFDGASLVEFSPQDVLASRRAVEKIAVPKARSKNASSLIEKVYADDGKLKPSIASLYEMFGVTRYASVDLLDHRANWKQDFNHRFKLPRQFDIVTNFGTAEHVFNIANVFASIHDALKPGGVALHVLPAFGDIDHGFFNIHPTLYFDLAQANGYVIEDLLYVDRWDLRNCVLEETQAPDGCFDGLPITREILIDRETLQRRVSETFLKNLQSLSADQYGKTFPSIAYDYCICALRKVDDAPFRYPIQGYYGGGSVATTPSIIENSKLISLTRNYAYIALRPLLNMTQSLRGRLKLGRRLRSLLRH